MIKRLPYKLLIIVVAGVVLLTIFIYLKNSQTGNQEFRETNSSLAIEQLQEEGIVTSIIIDYAECPRGMNYVSFGLGSTTFKFLGINNGSCEFDLGTEIENPNWDGELNTHCEIPTYLMQQRYKVTDFGIELQPILDKYCT